MSTVLRRARLAARVSFVVLAGAATAALAAPGDQPVRPLPTAPAASSSVAAKSASLPARGLFEGDRLSARAQAQLTELVIDVAGRQVEVALIVPTGPWQVDGAGPDDRRLNDARLESVRRFLADRGIDRKRIYVESRIDQRAREPRLEVQVLSRPAGD